MDQQDDAVNHEDVDKLMEQMSGPWWQEQARIMLEGEILRVTEVSNNRALLVAWVTAPKRRRRRK